MAPPRMSVDLGHLDLTARLMTTAIAKRADIRSARHRPSEGDRHLKAVAQRPSTADIAAGPAGKSCGRAKERG
jgi:hypothetical protein